MAAVFHSIATPAYSVGSWTHVVPAGGALVVFDGDWNAAIATACTYGNKPMVRQGYVNNFDAVTVFTLEDCENRDDDIVRLTAPATRFGRSVAVISDIGGTLVFGECGLHPYATNIDYQNRYIDVGDYGEQFVASCMGVPNGAYASYIAPLVGTNQVSRSAFGGSAEGWEVLTETGNAIPGGCYNNSMNRPGGVAVSIYDVAAGGNPRTPGLVGPWGYDQIRAKRPLKLG